MALAWRSPSVSLYRHGALGLAANDAAYFPVTSGSHCSFAFRCFAREQRRVDGGRGRRNKAVSRAVRRVATSGCRWAVLLFTTHLDRALCDAWRQADILRDVRHVVRERETAV